MTEEPEARSCSRWAAAVPASACTRAGQTWSVVKDEEIGEEEVICDFND